METGRQRPVRQPAEERPRLGTLDSEHREVRDPVDHVDVERLCVGREPGEVALVVGGVCDGQEVAVGEPVGEQVVEHTAVLAAQDAVLSAALGQAADVVGQQQLEQRRGVGTLDLDLAHVRDVEHPRVSADREVLGLDALVLDRHLPARETDQLRPRGTVALV